MRIRKTSLLLLGSALSAGMAPASLAQTSGPVEAAPAEDAATRGVGIPDIIVTAQRRAQSLQEVPLSVTVASGEMLEKAGIADVKALGLVTPGLQVVQTSKNVTAFIRGVGSQQAAPGGESAVAIYVDGVYYPAQSAAISSFNNIRDIQVLKGPQGTLFGRNASGGLIQISTLDPQQDPEVEAIMGYGNYKTASGSLYATSGLAQDLAADFAGRFVHQGDGWGRNLFRGNEVNRQREYNLRSKLRWTPGEWAVTLAGDYSRNTTDIGITRGIFPGSVAVGGVVQRGSIYNSQVTTAPEALTRTGGASLRIQGPIGGINFSSTTAYRKGKDYALFDNDSTPADIQTGPQYGTSRSIQQELLGSGKLGRLDYTIGGFFLNSRQGVEPLLARSTLTPAATNMDQYNVSYARSFAVFGQVDFRITDNTTLTAGVRHTWDRQKIAADRFGASAANAGVLLFTRRESKSFQKTTFRFAIDQQIGADAHAYVSFNCGYKSGLYSLTIATNPIVNPESIDAYEAGLKSFLFDRRLRLNAAIFHYNYSNVQLSARIGLASLLYNAAAAKITGLEVQADFSEQVGPGTFNLSTGLSYIPRAEYTDFPGAVVNVPRAGGGNTTVTRPGTGQRMINAAKATVNVVTNYSFDIGGGQATLFAAYYHNSGFFTDPENRLRQRAYDLVNARIGYQLPNSPIELRLHAENLLNTKYFTSFYANTSADSFIPGAPRTYGAEMIVRF
ncbi:MULTISPECIES: TonB-dependent receptor [unclassified Sphingobium]|uniref:TonB-dependent receptor n=1 Tax=unclassified Sphingobium TaxID=2611147 RepID=UPI00119C626A|nr:MULTISPECIES: TonB-dependent receptor [unclassified Sphingobium]MBG6119960.1 iron complex outermembrane receptor protein [Sphingobium sp. JAI105]TWC99601.1 iron complex outermembrane receptor protein [Sphingobium sp. AEW010]TWD18962.1 iron complex outermembrane receptor protein [Sphingobium sp. AEW013]TWD21833.1 iron complex outermembrane receptor protein [Sphingobium sp. AEW001]